MRRYGAIVVAAGLAVAGVVLPSSSAPAQASPLPTSCSAQADVWLPTPGATDWDTAANWSAGVPTATTDACLPAGSYTVTITGSDATVATAEVLSGVTLELEGNRIPGYGDVTATLTASGAITNTGTIALTEEAGSEAGTASINDPSGTITNAGTISTVEAPDDTDSTRTIDAGLVNEGAVEVLAPLTFTDSGANITDTTGGTITTAAGTTLSVGQEANGGPGFDLDGGSVDNQGSFVQYGGAFAHDAGSVTGNAVELYDVALDPSLGDGTGAGSVTFELFGANNTLTGNVAPSDTLWVDGSTEAGYANVTGVLTASGPITNGGTIEMSEAVGAEGGQPGAGATLTDTSGTITNTGTITTLPAVPIVIGGTTYYDDDWARTINASVDNEGTLNILSPTTFLGGGDTVTDGPGASVTVTGGVTLTIGQYRDTGDEGPSFALDGGSISSQGTFVMYGGTFTHLSGVATGNPLQLYGVALDPSLDGGAGRGSASFEILGGGNTLLADVAAPETLAIDGFVFPGYSNVTGVLTASGPITNAGTIEMSEAVGAQGGQPGAGATLTDTSGTITNIGTLAVVPAVPVVIGGTTYDEDGWGRTINASLVNEGDLEIDQGTGNLSVNGDYTQTAAATLATEVGGTATGSYGQLYVFGDVDLAGNLRAEPSSAYAANAQAGDTLSTVPYTGTRTGSFAEAAVVPENTSPPVITGTVAVGQALTCSQGTFTDSPTAYSYQWNRNGTPIQGADTDRYTLQTADSGASITCTVTASGGAGLDSGLGFSVVNDDPATRVDLVVGSGSVTLPGEATSLPAAVPASPIPTSPPAVTGTSQPGQVLACSEGTWGDAPSGFSYAWVRDATPIPGATSSSYTVQSADTGHSLTCVVTAMNASGSTSATSNAVSVPSRPVSTSPPVVTGTPEPGQVLACSEGTWGNAPSGFSYAWVRDATPIAGATSSSYTVQSADAGHSLTCVVTAMNASGSTSATSNAVSVPSRPVSTSPPVVTGTPEPGQVLACSEGTWGNAPSGFSYAWVRDATPIAGATSSSYTVQSADAGHSLTCVVTAMNASGSASATSAPVDAVAEAVTIPTASLPQAVGANPYSQALTACGGDVPSCEHWSTTSGSLVDASGSPVTGGGFTFSLVGGALPPGVTLSREGLLSGTPTQTGTYDVSFTASDPIADTSAPVELKIVVVPGISVTTADGSYSDGGPITAGSVTVSPSGAGPIDSVVTANGSDDHATIAGAAADNDIGVQVTDVGSFCTTDLDIAGAAGSVLSLPGIAVNGCGSGATADRLGGVRSGSSLAENAVGPAPSHAGAFPKTSSCTPGSVTATNSDGTFSGTVAANGTFDLTIPAAASTGVTAISVCGGTYTSELDGADEATASAMSALVDVAASIPATLAVTPLTAFVDSYATQAAAAGTPLPTAHAGTTDTAALMSSYGFATAAPAEQVVPSFASTTTLAYSELAATESGIEEEAASLALTDRGSLVELLAQEMEDGVFGGTVAGQTITAPTAESLPVAAGTSLFLPGTAAFQAASPTAQPSLPAAAVSSITPALPVIPGPAPPSPTADDVAARITRIGPDAFTETIVDPGPYLADQPFSPKGTTYTVEVVSDS